MGTCHVRATELYCDLDETYLAENPREVHGTVEFWVTVRTEVSQNTETTYDFGDVSTTVTVTPNPNTCPDCVFEGRDNQKYGDYFLDDEGNHYINWAIRVKAPATGMVGGETVTVTDPIGANLEVQSVYVRETTTVGADGVGNQNPIDWQNKPQGEYTVQNNDGTVTVSFESEAGHFYDVRIVTRVWMAARARTATRQPSRSKASRPSRSPHRAPTAAVRVPESAPTSAGSPSQRTSSEPARTPHRVSRSPARTSSLPGRVIRSTAPSK